MAYHCKNDVCVPDDLAQAGIFKALQRAINEVIKSKAVLLVSDYRIAVDGKIGWATTNMVYDILIRAPSLNDKFPWLDARGVGGAAIPRGPSAVAPYAAPLAQAFADYTSTKIDVSNAPTWLTVVSPPVAYAWAVRSLFGVK